MASPGPSELDLVEKVFLKIVLSESDDQFQTSLNGFLAPILLKISSTNQAVKAKILELLSHINKRLKSRPKVQLPLDTLITQYQDANLSPIVRNFTIIYIKMGYQRAEKELQISIVPRMLSCLCQRVQDHQNIFLQNILFHLNDYTYPVSIDERKKQFQAILDNAAVLKYIMEYFYDFLLLPYNLGLDMKDATVAVPPSLSREGYSRLKSDPVMTKDQIESAKLGILKFLSSEMFQAEDIICHFIIASSDFKHSVADKADHLIKTFSSADMWQNKDLMNKLLILFQGTAVKPSGPVTATSTASDKIRSASSIPLKLKLFPFILKSRIVIDLNPPMCLQMIFGCLFGELPGETLNLKIKIYAVEFICNACDNSSEKTMNFLAPLFKQALCRVSFNKKEDSKLRSWAFSGFSRIAKRHTDTFKKDLALLQKLIVMLEEEESDLKISIQDALSTISHAFKGISGTDMKMMELLILSNVEKEQPSLRLVALQLANAAFPSTHVLSRYACLLCSADSNDSVKEEANRGIIFSKSKSEDDKKLFYPKYNEICQYLYEKLNKRKSKGDTKGLVLPVPVLEKLLTYINQCLHVACDVTEQDEINHNILPKVSKMVQSYLDDQEITDISKSHVGRHIELTMDCLVPTAGHNLHSIALMNLLELVASYPSKLSPMFTEKVDWLQTFFSSSKDSVRESSARLISIVICNLTDLQTRQLLDECIEKVSQKKGFEETHGCILTTAYILGRHSQVMKMQDVEMNGEKEEFDVMAYVKKALKVFASKLTDDNTVISAACCSAIGEIGKQYVLPLPDDDDEEGDLISKKTLIGKLSSLLENAPESKVKEKAVSALGFICVGDSQFTKREEVLKSLLESSKIRQPELHFNIGEAMSCLAAGRYSQIAKDSWVLNEKDSIPNTGEDYLHTNFTSVLQRIIKESIHNPVAHVRQAGVIWLLCIAKYSSRHPSLQGDVVDEIQSAFIDLLSDSDDITQDVASRGLGVIYDLVKPETKEKMVSLLVERLMSGKRTKQVVEDNTELFKPGTLGKDPDGGKISTYKELCSLATSLNKPDLVYKFLNLANHNAMWNSRKGAAFGFLSISKLAGDQLQPYLVEIIPKLYRYQYDPNAGVRKAMTSIWTAIVPDGKRSVDKYTKEILKELLSNITSNTWRIRESCCLGLNDLIKTCPVDDILEKLSSLWELVFKVMDDIKESVRVAATNLGKTMGRLSVRLCDVNQSKLGEKSVSEVLPVLLDVGLSSNVAEVKSLSLKTLVDVSKNAIVDVKDAVPNSGREKGTYLKSHIPKFVSALLESLSNEEPQYLNTLSLQLSQNQDAQDKLDAIRLSASKSSPMMDAIKYCIQYVDEAVLTELVPRICDLIKTGVGLGTKVGCSTLVIQLTMQCKETLTPFIGKLLASFLNGMNDRNNQIKKSNANAIGHLLMYAKESSAEKLLNKLMKWYFEREDESIHLSCAWCINAMGKYSPDKLSQFNTLVLPFVFIAKQGVQSDGKVVQTADINNITSLWEEIWNNNTSGNMAAIKLYLPELYELIVPSLTSQSWGLRTKAAQAILTIADSLGSSMQQPHIDNFLNLLVDSLQGRTWDGKENILKSISKICVKCSKAILEEKASGKGEMMEKVMTALTKECKKESIEYKICAINTITDIIDEWKLNTFNELNPILIKLLQPSEDDSDDEDEVDGGKSAKKKKLKEEINAVAFESLGKLWPDDKEVQKSNFMFMLKQLKTLDASPWKTQLNILKCATLFVERTHWTDACTEWKTGDEKDNFYATEFCTSIIPSVCNCVETSTYSSLKLAGVKFFIMLYRKAEGCSELPPFINVYTDRIQAIGTQLSSSTDCNISNHALELCKLMKTLVG